MMLQKLRALAIAIGLIGLSTNIVSAQSFPQPNKEVGIYDGSGNFVPQTEFVVGQNAVVKLTANGAESGGVSSTPYDIIIAYDFSGSMAYRWNGEFDNDPNSPIKNDVAKQAVHELIANANPAIDQIGLILFSTDISNNAIIKHPLTSDFTSLKNSVDSIVNPKGGTPIGDGLELSRQQLVTNGRPEATKIIILMADGSQNNDRNIFQDQILKKTAADNIPIFSIGFGGEIQQYVPDTIKDDTGVSTGFAWYCPDTILGYNDLRAYWHLNEYDFTDNWVGIKNKNFDLIDLVMQGVRKGNAVPTPSGYLDGGLSLDGSGDYLEIDNQTNPLINVTGSESVSLSIWFKSQPTGNIQYIYSKGTGNGSYYLRINPDGTLESTIEDANGDKGTVNTLLPKRYDDNNWHHAVTVISRGSGTLRLYVDGGLRDVDLIPLVDTLTNSKLLRLGRFSTGGSEYFKGTLDEFRFYDKALSSSEVNQLFNFDNGQVLDTGEKYMQCMARYTQGQYFFAPSPDDLISIFSDLKGAVLEWHTQLDDFLVSQYFTNITVDKVTDLNNNPVGADVTVNANHISGDLGILQPDTGRVIYVQTTISPGSSGSSWSTPVDASPNTNNKVTYTNPNDASSQEVLFINANPLITIRQPLSGSISGTVYNDENYNCSADGGEAGINQAGITLQQLIPSSPQCSSSPQSQTPAASGAYGFTNLDCFNVNDDGTIDPATYRLTFSSTDPTYTERCGNVFNINLSEGTNYTQNLFLSQVRDPWFQTQNGSVYANGSITSTIPSTATEPLLITRSGGSADSIAIATGFSLGEGSLSDSNWTAPPSAGNPIDLIRLRNQIIERADESNYNGHSPTFGHTNDDGLAIYYAPGNVTLNGNWQNIDFPAIVFVDGSVIIPSTLSPLSSPISLTQNGFLMIVATQDITLADTIGSDSHDSTAAQLEGAFVAGRNFDAGGTGDRNTDKRLNISGTVVVGADGAGAYISDRNIEENHFYPSDYFIYNPKLIANVPDFLSTPIYSWKEVR